MIRTKTQTQSKLIENITYDIQQEPIVLSKLLLDHLLKMESPSDLVALYTFYYYTAKWQRTNCAKATTFFVAQGLQWSKVRVQKNKKTLITLGLIEDKKTYDENNRITGHYIKLNLSPSEKAIHTVSHPVEILGTNALRTNIEKEASPASSFSSISSSQELHPNTITKTMFEDFWKLYPRKVDKGKALSKWISICGKPPKERPSWRDIKRALLIQMKSERWRDPQYIPHPTTWLNQRRWMDDPNEMTKPFDRDKPQTRIENGRTYKLSANGKYWVDREGNVLYD